MYKRFMSIILIFAVALSLGVNVYAGVFLSEIQQITALVGELLPTVIATEGLSIGKIELGSKLSVYRVGPDGLEDIDYDIYPILSNNQVIALANVSYNDASCMQVSCGVDFANELRQYLSLNNPRFAIIYADGGVYAVNNNGAFQRIKEEYTPIQYALTEEMINAVDISTASISIVQTVTLGVIPRVYLDVERVYNGTTDCCIGLCWAATIAMIANYYEGTSYDAYDIHEDYGCLGFNPNTANGFATCMYGLGMANHFLAEDLNYDEMFYYTENDRLLFLRLKNTVAGQYGHAILGYGYMQATSSTASNRICIMDPNTGHKTFSFPNSGAIQMTLSGNVYELDYYIAVVW